MSTVMTRNPRDRAVALLAARVDLSQEIAAACVAELDNAALLVSPEYAADIAEQARAEGRAEAWPGELAALRAMRGRVQEAMTAVETEAAAVRLAGVLAPAATGGAR